MHDKGIANTFDCTKAVVSNKRAGEKWEFSVMTIMSRRDIMSERRRIFRIVLTPAYAIDIFKCAWVRIPDGSASSCLKLGHHDSKFESVWVQILIPSSSSYLISVLQGRYLGADMNMKS